MLCQKAVVENQRIDGFGIGVQSVLNTLNVGVILLRNNGEVILANSAAEAIMSRKCWLRVVDQKLRCRPEESAELEYSLRMAAENQTADSECILHLSGPDRQDGVLLAFSFLDLQAGSQNTEMTPEAPGCVMCMVVDPNHNKSTDAELLKRLYPLTDAEAKIAAFLANGLDYSEIAQHRNVTVSTVRSYSKSIFKKLCVNSRAGVVRKVLTATIPLSLDT